jgi:hypothetical protein
MNRRQQHNSRQRRKQRSQPEGSPTPDGASFSTVLPMNVPMRGLPFASGQQQFPGNYQAYVLPQLTTMGSPSEMSRNSASTTQQMRLNAYSNYPWGSSQGYQQASSGVPAMVMAGPQQFMSVMQHGGMGESGSQQSASELDAARNLSMIGNKIWMNQQRMAPSSPAPFYGPEPPQQQTDSPGAGDGQ